MLRASITQPAKRFIAVYQFSALCLCEAVFDLRRYLGAVFGKPFFLFVEHLDRPFDKLIRGLIGAAFNIPLDEGLQFRLQLNRHIRTLRLEEGRVNHDTHYYGWLAWCGT